MQALNRAASRRMYLVKVFISSFPFSSWRNVEPYSLSSVVVTVDFFFFLRIVFTLQLLLLTRDQSEHKRRSQKPDNNIQHEGNTDREKRKGGHTSPSGSASCPPMAIGRCPVYKCKCILFPWDTLQNFSALKLKSFFIKNWIYI